MNIAKTVGGILALVATLTFAQSASAGSALLSPRAAAAQPGHISGNANDTDWVHGAAQNAFQSPRALSGQTRVAVVSSAKDVDFAHNQNPLLSGKDSARDQYARNSGSASGVSYQLAPVK